jgi:hypothetical protein
MKIEIKEKLNITTIIRKRKDKIGKVKNYFIYLNYSKDFYLVNNSSNTRI